MIVLNSGLGLFVWPIAGACLGWVIWHIPPLRFGVEVVWLRLTNRERETYGFDLQGFMVGWGGIGLTFILIYLMSQT